MVDDLTGGNPIACPVRVRDSAGKFHRNPGGEWDWYYDLPVHHRRYIRRNHMEPHGLGPDNLATMLGESIDAAMNRWLSEVWAER